MSAEIFDDDGNYIGMVEPTVISAPNIGEIKLVNINETEMWMFMEYMKLNKPRVRWKHNGVHARVELNELYEGYLEWHGQLILLGLHRATKSTDVMMGHPYQIYGGHLTIHSIEKIQ